MLDVKNITAGYGKLQILNGMSIHVVKNTITAILGGNGCGKSTTLKAITGLLKVTSGDITFEGESLLRVKPQDIVKRGIAYVTQGKDVFPSMTVEENLLLGAYCIKDRKVIKNNIEMVLESMPRLKTRFKSPSGVLSGGEQQMLSIGRGLMSNPKLLILDEPSAALSPKIAEEVYDHIVKIHKSGVTILLVEQNVRAALRISGYTYILSEGRVVMEDTTQNIRKHPDIKSFYLGNLPGKK
ncbi:MAG: ABC transporter ATP-binding protein [Clostridiaceae bacterium]|jgi:branched-chain amino acid transport system ATP-binding protein|nr:ABC transporter ATP-binding protein [Clostridiaceae bacterium]